MGRSWRGSVICPGPVAVTYEAGPTGFGLARALTAAGIGCEVAAPSKLIRPAGDRVKTDVRDAAHLARLLHLGQITAVTVPTATQEAVRDLVRAREDCRGDLMTARHRVSKLLLRQGRTSFGRPSERRVDGAPYDILVVAAGATHATTSGPPTRRARRSRMHVTCAIASWVPSNWLRLQPERMEIEVPCGTTAIAMDDDSITVRDSDGEERIPARTKVWAAGVKASPLAGLLARATGAETDRAGRICSEGVRGRMTWCRSMDFRVSRNPRFRRASTSGTW